MPKRITPKKLRKRRFVRLVLKLFFAGSAALLLVGLILFIYFIKDLPRPERFTEGSIAQSSKIYDRTGKILLYEIFGEEKRTIVPLSKIPKYLQEAVVATEDKNFYNHKGLDLKAIARAILFDLKIGKPSQGASTITQQLIRSYFLTQKKTLKRKTREIILTLEIERRYSKKQILEWYLNLIPFGGPIYGAEEAARSFFGKDVSSLSLPESAVLAALIKSPSYLSPYGPHKKELLERKNYVLERMEKLGFISKKELEEAKKEAISFREERQAIKAPHFVVFVKNYLERKYGRDFLNRKGLKIYTTLDYSLQQKAEEILKSKLEELKAYNANNGALVSINPKTGEVLAMVGSKDYFGEPYPEKCKPGVDCLFDPKVNAALSARQPGSALKPFIYAGAFLKGFIPDTLLWDVKTEFNLNCPPDASQKVGKYNTKCYHPKNYDGRYLGLISLRSALAQSRNVPSVKVLYLVGLDKALELLNEFGITTLKKSSNYGLSLVLGGGEVKLLDLTAAYGVLADNGVKAPLVFIKKIEDSKGNILEKPDYLKTRIIPSQVAEEINDILSDNKARAPMFGFNSYLKLKNYKAAAKTGTTQDYRDAWIVGYTPNLVTGVWVGNNDNSPLFKKPAVSLAGPIWNEFMEVALKSFPKEDFVPPGKRLAKKPILQGDKPLEHNILFYLNPQDPQNEYWEFGVINYLKGRQQKE
jgi:1A family penicillin-binding protein